jgi:stage III sporulation protein AH
MNSKRQTIWLVSMLSLMVVLSAYYLFTEDVYKLKNAADPTQSEQIQVSTEQTDPASGKATVGTAATDKTATDTGKTGGQADTTGKTAATDKTAADASKTAGKAAADPSTAKQTDTVQDQPVSAAAASSDKKKSSEEEILNKVASQGTSEADYFAYNQMQQSDQLAQKIDQLTEKMSNAKLSLEEQTQVQQQYDALEKQQAMTQSIQEQLQKDGYSDALVQLTGGKWNITVQSGKLEKSQAVSILDLAADVLNVSPDKIVVQFHK